MFTTLKLVVGWDCNLDCSYCCNKLPSVKDSFQPITYNELSQTNYNSYEITGGEILLPKYFSIVRELCCYNLPKDKDIYVYTNGLLLNNRWAANQMKAWGIKGINIGYHNIGLDWDTIIDIHETILPVRLWVMKADIEQFILDLDIPIRLWELGECDEIRTDRCYLKVAR